MSERRERERGERSDSFRPNPKFNVSHLDEVFVINANKEFVGHLSETIQKHSKDASEEIIEFQKIVDRVAACDIGEQNSHCVVGSFKNKVVITLDKELVQDIYDVYADDERSYPKHGVPPLVFAFLEKLDQGFKHLQRRVA